MTYKHILYTRLHDVKFPITQSWHVLTFLDKIVHPSTCKIDAIIIGTVLFLHNDIYLGK